MTKIFTIGHSNRPIERFIELLKENAVERLVDIRTLPKSRHNPQFDQAQLAGSVAAAGIEYRHMPTLGGLRKPSPASRNTGWRNTSFRGYADWMQTGEFAEAADALVAMAGERTTAIMCAEAVPWRCHRSLVGDALLVRGVEVFDIMGSRSTRLETLTPFAVVDGMSITYPPYEETLPD